jgi:hypothetical protein
MGWLDGRAALGCAVVVFSALLACDKGGANQNQKGVGDQPGGVKLGIGDIAVAPFGNYVVFNRDSELAVGRIENGDIESLPVSYPTRLAFSKTRPVIYVGSGVGDQIVAVDTGSRQALWQSPVAETDTDSLLLGSTKNDKYVVAAGPYSVEVLDAGTGSKRGEFQFARAIVDVVLLPDSSRALVVEEHEWQGDAPITRVTSINLETNARLELNVPNCSDKIAVSGDSKRAFLAPTTCQRDPVSVIDLTPDNEHFDHNLPGFGPVAIAPDGTLGVAFLDASNVDASLFDDPSLIPPEDGERYHLMLIDTGNLKYEFTPVGDDLPRFAITPDGNVLLVDTTYSPDAGTRLFDVPSRSFKYIQGSKFTLDAFALSSDSTHAYVLDDGLLDVDIPGAKSSSIDPGFAPYNLNISADDKLLFLRKNSQEICIWDLAAGSCERKFVVGVQMP